MNASKGWVSESQRQRARDGEDLDEEDVNLHEYAVVRSSEPDFRDGRLSRVEMEMTEFMAAILQKISNKRVAIAKRSSA